MPRRRALMRAALGAGWVGLAAFALHAVTGAFGARFDRIQAPWLYDAIAACALIVVVGRAVERDRDATTWRFAAVGLGAWLLGDVYWYANLAPLEAPPYPSVADAFYLMFFPACYLAITHAVRVRVRGLPRAGWLDGLVAALTAAAVIAAFAFHPVVVALDGSVAMVVTTLAYPVADVLLLGLLAGGLTVHGRRPDRALALVTAGLALTSVADVLYLFRVASGTYEEGGPLDVLWPATGMLIATAAFQPKLSVASRTTAAGNPEAIVARFAAVCVALLAIDCVDTLDVTAKVPLTLALALVIVRFGLALREVRRLERSRRDAITDDLTGLANRRRFYEALDDAFASPGARPGVLLVDLDRFKDYNDTLGHQAGDELLREFAARMARALPGALVARLGGDEFIALLDEPGVAAASRAAAHVHAQLEAPFQLEGLALVVRASIGVALAPEHGDSRSELMRHADIAMYGAKTAGSGTHVFAPSSDAPTRERLALVGELRRALDADELVLVYQPKIALAGRGVAGVEALVRWCHPRRGLLAPDAFIGLAERHGLMGRLTLRVLDLALAQQRDWRAAGLCLPVSVNVAATNLLDREFATVVRAALGRWGVPPDALRLEITEDVIMAEPGRVLDLLARLGELGVALSLDDYGTGTSSLAQLKRLPVQELKLDRSFVCNLDHDPQDAVIVRSTIEMACSLGLQVVAEGVESEAALDMLGAFGCHVAQGFHLSPPLASADVPAWVAQWTASRARAA